MECFVLFASSDVHSRVFVSSVFLDVESFEVKSCLRLRVKVWLFFRFLSSPLGEVGRGAVPNSRISYGWLRTQLWRVLEFYCKGTTSWKGVDTLCPSLSVLCTIICVFCCSFSCIYGI